jgi:hypothetical protein
MAHTVMSTQVTGYVVLASDWNEMVNNFIAGATDAMTADGDIWVGTGANAGVKLAAFTSSTGTLKQEQGGLEFNASAVTTNDGIGGASAGVLEIKTPVTQAEAEAGTNTRFSLWSSERVKQAIAALSGGDWALEGSDLTESTTTSTSEADIQSAGSLSIAQGQPCFAFASLRKTTGASAKARVGLKLNSTSVRSHTAWSATANSAVEGYARATFVHARANYLRSGEFSQGSEDQAGTIPAGFDSDMPTAQMTTLVITGSVSSGSITMGVADLYVYSMAVS